MTKLEELKAAVDAAEAVYDAALYTECACDAARADAAACVAARDATDVTYGIYVAARDAYEAELKKTQKEQTNDTN